MRHVEVQHREYCERASFIEFACGLLLPEAVLILPRLVARKCSPSARQTRRHQLRSKAARRILPESLLQLRQKNEDGARARVSEIIRAHRRRPRIGNSWLANHPAERIVAFCSSPRT
jgi:hypothetical protein